MKKIFAFAFCAFALVACNKPEPLKVTADYKACTFLSRVKHSGLIVEELPSAEDYFDNLEKELNEAMFYVAQFSAEDMNSTEFAYQKTDEEASKLIPQLRAMAEETLDGILDTFNKKDIGSGDFTYKFTYTFGREGKDLDSFTSDIVYKGGDRLPADAVAFALAGKQAGAVVNVRFTGIDTDIAESLTFSDDIKVCLPDNTFADETTYGKMASIKKAVIDKEEGCFNLELHLSADEAHMANIKAKAGNWHLLAPATAEGMGDKYNFIVYIPLVIVDAGF